MEETEPKPQYLVQESDLTDRQRLKIKTRAASEALRALNDELLIFGPDDEFRALMFEEFRALMFEAEIELNLWNQNFERNGRFR
jgi:hypothetical protein